MLRLKLGDGPSLHLPPLLVGPLSLLGLPRASVSWEEEPRQCRYLCLWHLTSWESGFIHVPPLILQGMADNCTYHSTFSASMPACL